MKDQHFFEQEDLQHTTGTFGIRPFVDRKSYLSAVLLPAFFLIYTLVLPDFAWAVTCEYCPAEVPDGRKYCFQCETKFKGDQAGNKAKEEQLVNSLISSRNNYKKALADLSQFYLDIGYALRLEQVRKETKALNKIPEYEYLLIIEEPVTFKPDKNIEEANILFEDGKMYKKSFNIINKKSNLNTAVKRFKKILDYYPGSDLADDAAYELAEIFAGFFFQDYEVAAAYYVKCFTLNPNTNRPARYMAASIYEEHLKDNARALQYYELALKMGKDENLRKKAQAKITELKKQGL
ncbi:MAG: hypothetical protein MRK01_00460 [Candidatus Scalindua sp.]|nr:hypothetical protein [Candidatus Scalindua sp.]